MFRVRKSFIKVLLGIFICFVLFTGICIYLAYQYTSNVPKLTPKKEVFVISPEESYTPSDFVNVECVGEYELDMYILETDIPTARAYGRSWHNDTIYVGDTKGTIRLNVRGYGKRSEAGKDVEITLIVE